MYNAQDLKEHIKSAAAIKGILIKTLLSDCGLNINTLNQITDKKGMSCFSLAQIADYLDCSVDYLLGRQPSNHFNIKNTGDNVGVVGQANAPVTIHNGTENKLSEQETALLDIFSKLDVGKQAKLLVFAAELGKDL